MGIDKFLSITELDKKKTGAVDANGAVIKRAGKPKDPDDLTTKTYVDELFEMVDNRVEFIAKNKPISIRSENETAQSAFELSPSNIFIQAAPASGERNDGGSCNFAAGNGNNEGKGGDINLVPGVGGKVGRICAYGSVNINGFLQFHECEDPGEPSVNVVYLWFDKSDRMFKIRKKGEEDLILI